MPIPFVKKLHNKKGKLLLKVILVIIIVILVVWLAVYLANKAKENANKKIYADAITTARNLMWKDINSGKAASAEVAIMDNGKIVYSEGFGMANREKNIPVTNNTIFNIGSVSKVYVMAAIMKLVDQGKVSLDDPITKYIPEFTMADPRYKNITVRMILDHANGLPGSNYANAMDVVKPNANMQQDTLDTLSHSHLKADPGAVSPYTNDGFTLAETIVEKISGQKYIDFLTKNILQPLGLNNTGLSVGELTGKQIATTYNPTTGKAKPAEVVSVIGAGGLSSTATELCRFADAITSSNNGVLSQAAVAELKKQQPSTLATELGKNSNKFGIGWDFTNIPAYDAQGLQVLGKDGGTYQYTSMVYIIPSKRICVAGIESSAGSNVDANINAILNKVLVAKGLIPQEKQTVAVPLTPAPIPATYAQYSGDYVGTGGVVKQITIDTKNNTVTSHALTTETPDSIYFYNNGHFTNNDMGTSGYIDFVTIDGEQYIMAHTNATQLDSIISQKANPVKKPISLSIDMDKKGWLQRNVNPFVESADLSSHMTSSNLIKSMPGYVDFNGLKKVESPTFAGMPVSAMRDMTELQLIDKNGQTWVLNSDRLYSPTDKAGTVQSGQNSVTIGNDGYNQWLQTNDGMILSFPKQQGRVIVFGRTLR